jgi:hypothetical protein
MSSHAELLLASWVIHIVQEAVLRVKRKSSPPGEVELDHMYVLRMSQPLHGMHNHLANKLGPGERARVET